jgi:hypothetical protein
MLSNRIPSVIVHNSKAIPPCIEINIQKKRKRKVDGEGEDREVMGKKNV